MRSGGLGKERELMKNQIKQSMQKAPKEVQDTLKMSQALRDAHVQAIKDGKLDQFAQAGRHAVMSLYAGKSNGSVRQNGANVLAMQRKINQLENEVALYEMDMLLIQNGMADEVIKLRKK